VRKNDPYASAAQAVNIGHIVPGGVIGIGAENHIAIVKVFTITVVLVSKPGLAKYVDGIVCAAMGPYIGEDWLNVLWKRGPGCADGNMGDREVSKQIGCGIDN
jgi:hypothetical protein